MQNPVLSTNASSTEGILYWSYGISNRSSVLGIDYYPETIGRIGTRMEYLRVEAAIVQRVVNKELKWPHLRAIIEAKYGERGDAVMGCAQILRTSARTQSVENLVRLVEHFCLIRKYSDREVMRDFSLGRNAFRESRRRYEGILEGWLRLSLDVLEDAFRERGWVE